LSDRIKVEVRIAHSKLKKRGIGNPTEDEIYKIISSDMIMNSYMENREEEKDDDFLGNFYTYVQLACSVTGNHTLMDTFKGLRKWINERTRKYCSDLVKREEKLPAIYDFT